MSNQEPAVKPLNVSDVRNRLSDVFTDAVMRHRPVPIARGGKELGVLLGIEEIARLVEGISFEPEVFQDAGIVSVWLSEFQFYGRGKISPLLALTYSMRSGITWSSTWRRLRATGPPLIGEPIFLTSSRHCQPICQVTWTA